MARPICLLLLVQAIALALFLAALNAGSSIAARMAMIAMTTSSSISVNPVRPGGFRGRLDAVLNPDVCEARADFGSGVWGLGSGVSSASRAPPLPFPLLPPSPCATARQAKEREQE